MKATHTTLPVYVVQSSILHPTTEWFLVRVVGFFFAVIPIVEHVFRHRDWVPIRQKYVTSQQWYR